MAVCRVRAGWLIVAVFAGIAAVPASPQVAPVPGQLARQVSLDEQSPFAANAVLLRRLLGPREVQRRLTLLAARHATLAAYPLDPRSELFAVYLPRQQPAAGYGLLVFVPPWQDAQLPFGWASVLDRSGIVFVSAARSGNDEDITSRRIPLALTAAHALAQRYRINPDRVYIGGFSGGSRVALRIALAYPDIFSGVLLNAGSDPIAEPEDTLPAPSLMKLLQTHSRFVFVTGDDDDVNLAKDVDARSSLSQWCIDATRTLRSPHTGHEVMDAASLSLALAALDKPTPVDPARHGACKARMDARVEQARREAASLLAQPPGPRTDAGLDRLDRTYGSLLGPG